jgi:hypothetical protein
MDAAEAAPAESEELQRLRRQLRAQSAVNRQLHAQIESGTVRVAASGLSDGLDGTGGALTQRRVELGGSWLKQLHMHGGRDPILVHTPTQGDYVVEGGMRRPIKAWILIAALTRVLGPPREVSDQEVQRWSEGPPVMVMESGSGPPFLIVGSRRLPLRGLPMPHLVSTADMLLFSEGEELNVAGSRGVRAVQRLENEGPLRGGVKLARQAGSRFLKSRGLRR